MSSKYAIHQKFLKEVILFIQDEFKGIRLWEIATGQAYAKFSVMDAIKYALKTGDINGAIKKLIIIVYGKVGHPDVTGIYYGRWIGIEIKTGSAVQSDDQRNFQKMIQDRNGIYLVVSNKYPIENQIKELIEMREICQTSI